MFVRLYELMWVVGILAVGLFYVMGDLTPVATVVFGFLAVTVVFMGMISVLPAVIHDRLRPH